MDIGLTTMDKSDKRRCKNVSAHTKSLITKCRNDGEDRLTNWRNYRQERDLPHVCHVRSERRQSNPPVDSAGYQCPTDTYRLGRHHNATGSSRLKYHGPSAPAETFKVESNTHGILRASGGQLYAGNVAIVRKTRCKKDVDENDETKYVDENFPTEDNNAEEETGEEVADEEQENASEYSDKDYEEHQADDEVDEESDVLDRHVDRPRTQRRSRAEPPMRVQRNNVVEPSLQHRAPKVGVARGLERYRHVAERNNVEVPTEEDEEEEDEYELCQSTPYSLKKPPWKYQASHRDVECRTQPRNHVERYPNLEGISSGHRPRRPRTTKPDVESSMTSTRVPHVSIRTGRCSQCGVLSGQTPKTTSSKNANCRLQDSRYFTRVPIGDEGEDFKDAEPIISYQTKPRRSNESRSHNYDPREEARTMDAELGAIYKSCRSKNLRALSNDVSERARHSVRVSNRHEPLKNDNHYWS